MANETILRRYLYAGTSLIILVILLLAFLVIPSGRISTSPVASPDGAIQLVRGFLKIHLFIMLVFMWTIINNLRGGTIKNGLLVALGLVMFLLSLLMVSFGFASTSHTDPIMRRIVISLVICGGCNFIVGFMTFFTLWYTKRIYAAIDKFPSWLFALFILIVAIIFFFFTDGIWTPRAETGIKSHLINNIIIASGCFFIVWRNPKSIWYVPLICNALLILFSVIDPNFWRSSMIIPICGGWALSMIVSIIAAQLGIRRHNPGELTKI